MNWYMGNFRGCGKSITLLKPAGQSALTLEWEEAKHVPSKCGMTGYGGHTELCDPCEVKKRETAYSGPPGWGDC